MFDFGIERTAYVEGPSAPGYGVWLRGDEYFRSIFLTITTGGSIRMIHYEGKDPADTYDRYAY